MFRLLENDGVLLHIGGRALDLLLVLAERPGEVVKRFQFRRDEYDRHPREFQVEK
jgi:DNA-binding winged helix-turn-helix (wHTH) protein